MMISIKGAKRCAFCTNWYDPTNSCISPKNPRINLWEFDSRAKNKCLIKNIDTQAGSYCQRYQCKLTIN